MAWDVYLENAEVVDAGLSINAVFVNEVLGVKVPRSFRGVAPTLQVIYEVLRAEVARLEASTTTIPKLAFGVPLDISKPPADPDPAADARLAFHWAYEFFRIVRTQRIDGLATQTEEDDAFKALQLLWKAEYLGTLL